MAKVPNLVVTARLSRWEIVGLLLLPVGLWLLWQVWVVVALLLLAVIAAIGLDLPISWLEAHGTPRILAIFALYAVAFVGLGGLGYGLSRVAASESDHLMATLHQWQATLNTNLLPADWLTGLTSQAVDYAGLAVKGVLGGLLVGIIAFYLLLDGCRLWRLSVRLFPDEQQEVMDMLGRRIAASLRGYLLGVTLSSLAVGILTGVGLALLGVPYALLFGVLAGALEIIPFFGPLLAALGPIALALAQSPIRALLVILFFVAVQQTEEKLLVPQLQAHTTGLHPLTVILTTLVLGVLFGFLGILLAVPLAAAVQAVVVCTVNCFTHPRGPAAWLQEHQSPLASGRQPAEVHADKVVP